MLQNSPMALRCLKAALNADCDGQAGLQELAGNATMLFYMTDEGQEGRNAFNENANRTSANSSVIRNAHGYPLPLQCTDGSGVILRHQRLKSRDGLLVKLQQGELSGWGEIAPLPEFSQETLDQAQVAAECWLQHWVSGVESDDSVLPSVAFGLSCAQAELKQTLPLSADYRKAPLCTGDPDELFAVLQALPGEKVAKVKVGLYEAVRDGMIVNVLLEALPDLTLRLDANRSWSRAKADGFAKYVNPALRSRIAFLEEPCKTRAESREFAQDTGIAIAWDESVREADFRLKPSREWRQL